tara:strand:+ start:2456 stop:2899 length:444 start_codon:yes stop_codon:yes gene_type:complete
MRVKVTAFFILLSLIPAPLVVLAKEEVVPIQAPETVEEAQEFGKQILFALPGAMKDVWEQQALPLWRGMWNWFQNIWEQYVFPWLQSLWNKILGIFGQEIEKRRPYIEEEFQKEKEELTQELKEKIPEPSKTLWDRLKGFFPGNEAE